MSILNILQSAWAIEPGKLQEIQAIYATHLRGEKIDLSALEARMGRPLASEQQEYAIRDGGVGVLSIEGVIAPKANMFTRISGGATLQLLGPQLESAIADPRTKSLVLLMDTPGGNVTGVPGFAQRVHELSAIKPIVTLSEGTLASGGLWIGCAANAVFIGDMSVQVGSLGVVIDHSYTPSQDGSVKTTITAGKYKRMVTSDSPLSPEAQAYLQQDVDYVYTLFVDEMARFRGVSSNQVLEHMADGRVFRGQQAIDAGLVDGVSTLDALAASMAEDPAKFAKRRKSVFAMPAGNPKSKGAGAASKDKPQTREQETQTMENPTLTRASFEQDHAALFAQVRAEFTTAGASQERSRIQAVLAVGEGLPGHEPLLNTLAFDGTTTAADASMRVLSAEKATRQAAIDAHRNDAPPAAKGSAAPANDGAKSPTQKLEEAKAHAKASGITLQAALKDLGYAS